MANESNIRRRILACLADGPRPVTYLEIHASRCTHDQAIEAVVDLIADGLIDDREEDQFGDLEYSLTEAGKAAMRNIPEGVP